MGMVWFMIPATLILCTVLLRQNEHTNHGILKMLALPISGPALCLAKFTVLILLTFVQMLLLILAYYLSAAAASAMVDYTLLLPPLFVFRTVFGFYLAAVPMAAVFWMIAVLIASPIFQIEDRTCFHRALRPADQHKGLVRLPDVLSVLSADDRIRTGCRRGL